MKQGRIGFERLEGFETVGTAMLLVVAHRRVVRDEQREQGARGHHHEREDERDARAVQDAARTALALTGLADLGGA